MADVIYTGEFRNWWDSLSVAEQKAVGHAVTLLETFGVALSFPRSSAIKGSKVAMRELRVQHAGRAFRVLYVFDPKRNAVLLVGGDKGGVGNWYEIFVPVAEAIYAAYLAEIEEEEG